MAKPNTPASPPADTPDTTTPSSTLDVDAINEKDRVLGKGQGTGALGPSGSSDSGSDIQGGPGWSQEIGIEGLETGTTSDPEKSTANHTAGPDVGDANLDSDSDATGSGETATAARDTVVPDGSDIDVDRVEYVGEVDNDVGDEDKLPTKPRGKQPDRGQAGGPAR